MGNDFYSQAVVSNLRESDAMAFRQHSLVRRQQATDTAKQLLKLLRLCVVAQAQIGQEPNLLPC